MFVFNSYRDPILESIDSRKWVIVLSINSKSYFFGVSPNVYSNVPAFTKSWCEIV